LEVSDALKLWNEGFRIVEDIYTLMQVGRNGGREGGREGGVSKTYLLQKDCPFSSTGRLMCCSIIADPPSLPPSLPPADSPEASGWLVGPQAA